MMHDDPVYDVNSLNPQIVTEAKTVSDYMIKTGASAEATASQIQAYGEAYQAATNGAKIYVNARESELIRMTEDISDEIFDRYFSIYPDLDQKATAEEFDRALMVARMGVQFPNMPTEDVVKAVDLYLELGKSDIFDDLLKQAEADEKAELFDMFEEFERIRAMRTPEPPKLNRAQRRAQAKMAKKQVVFRRSDKPQGPPPGSRQNEVPVSHAAPEHKDEARRYTETTQRERLANMYDDLADPNYKVPELPPEALNALHDHNKENAR